MDLITMETNVRPDVTYQRFQHQTCIMARRIVASVVLPIALLSTVGLAVPASPAQNEDPRVTALKKGESIYFTAKIQNLTDKLDLTPDQQRKLRPIAEQETAYLEQIRANPVLSKKDKLKRLRTIVHGSDQEMKSFLSAQQWQTLQALRKTQYAELKELANAK